MLGQEKFWGTIVGPTEFADVDGCEDTPTGEDVGISLVTGRVVGYVIGRLVRWLLGIEVNFKNGIDVVSTDGLPGCLLASMDGVEEGCCIDLRSDGWAVGRLRGWREAILSRNPVLTSAVFESSGPLML